MFIAADMKGATGEYDLLLAKIVTFYKNCVKLFEKIFYLFRNTSFLNVNFGVYDFKIKSLVKTKRIITDCPFEKSDFLFSNKWIFKMD